MKLFLLAILFAVLLSPCLAQTSILNFSDKGVSFNGKILTLPCSQIEITALLGSPSDIAIAPDNDSATVIEWSELGIYAYKKATSDTIHAIGVSISPEYPQRGFGKSFSGRLQVNQKNLALTKDTIKSLGFRRTSRYATWKQNLGSYYIRIITETPDDAREIEFGISSK